ncbi:tRNA(His) guanylyltransferase Thg1 family protein [Merismopedia glauca]|uniref:Guanylyltransferase n=1 Tax=Merismopedia glauca CCAP 1448/3 TaxID=1296344 RepID=A0A2T1C9H8_9CYAN|nr:tRNA(His) guanylyltransferase Thg1 family protein [Merismopedia glauca]PSB04901.1 guanylyltransferase [Merismopedia glauca CCAP 1448/3]
MKFNELDAKLRIFETAHDLCVLPEIFIVARLDGRNFTKLTKETYKFEAPFDPKFRDYMVATVEHLMGCGFHVIYVYTQSDEISLLLHRNEDAHRNALNAHCYWMLRKKGEKAGTATEKIEKISNSDKNELLYREGGINFNDLPKWQKRGLGLYWESYSKEGVNPISGEKLLANRRRIKVDLELPMKDEYGEFVKTLVLREHSEI